MAGLVLVVTRERAAARPVARRLHRLAARLVPDNTTPAPPDIREEDGLARLVVNPVAGVAVRPEGVCLGALFDGEGWATVGASSPEGTYALVRHDARVVELLTDAFATRTIWYVHRPEVFLASTSQRALVALLGRFEPCPEAATWMAAAGNLGPETAWDARLRRVPGAARLRLDRETWQLTTSRAELAYEPRSLSPDEHLARLQAAVFDVCARLDVERVPSALTLSGGYDSRSLLVGLARAGKSVRCVTWGLAASASRPGNDAVIARRLAERFGMPYEYLVLDPGEAPVRPAFTRFLEAGEGRIEDYSGYTDGCAAWKRLVESGVTAVIRGDSPGWGFPFPPVNDTVARSIVHEMTLVADYPEGDLIHRLGLAPQRPPAGLFMREGESLDHYRDRIYNEYELPSCMAAFNQVKCAYVEVVNPLLASSVVRVASELPDELRHLRCGFERMVAALVPDVPFASEGADEPLEHYLSRPPVVEELAAELSSQAARRVFAGAALDLVVDDLVRPLSEARRRLRERVRAALPERLIRTLRPAPRPHVTTRSLAWRMYIAARMAAILDEDAGFFAGSTAGLLDPAAEP